MLSRSSFCEFSGFQIHTRLWLTSDRSGQKHYTFSSFNLIWGEGQVKSWQVKSWFGCRMRIALCSKKWFSQGIAVIFAGVCRLVVPVMSRYHIFVVLGYGNWYFTIPMFCHQKQILQHQYYLVALVVIREKKLKRSGYLGVSNPRRKSPVIFFRWCGAAKIIWSTYAQARFNHALTMC